jgi:HAD superfamily phosphoserine phosphatase-like hydrolase
MRIDMAKWAVFDVDGTLLPEYSMEELFVNCATGEHLLGPLNFLRFALGAGKFLLRGSTEYAFTRNKAHFKNLPVKKVEALAKTCFQTEIEPRLSPRGAEVLNRYRQQNFRILVMTGSPGFLARYLDPIYQPDKLISSDLEISGDVLSGKSNLHPFAQTKKEVLLQFQPELEIDFQESIVFANHHSDVYHMELFGKAVAVNPTSRLQEIAGEQDWEVAWWD